MARDRVFFESQRAVIPESTKQAAILRFGLPPERFTVSHEGVDPVFTTASDPDLPEYYRNWRFIFSIGNSKPYKNLGRLLCAFASSLLTNPTPSC